jgi:hypothetical protein
MWWNVPITPRLKMGSGNHQPAAAKPLQFMVGFINPLFHLAV